ncbi:MAG: type I-E CRISPR-associated protein Cse2/CasB [Castellaniella sp.]
MAETTNTGQNAPSPKANPYSALAAYLRRIEKTDTGDRAALARLSPDKPLRPNEIAALSRALLAAGLAPDKWHPSNWNRWALIAHGMALAGHDDTRRLGAQLSQAGVAEPRVTKLLTARGDAFIQLLPSLLRLLASKGVAPNWYELGPLIHKQDGKGADQQDAEQIRLRIAGNYFSQQAKKNAA